MLRRPRFDLPRLTRQPGVVAAFAVAFAFGVETARTLTFTLRQIVRHDWVIEAHGHHHRFVWWERGMLPKVASCRGWSHRSGVVDGVDSEW